jgi:hypothetical protein
LSAFRFRPPPIELTRELRWALLRAFAPVDASVAMDVDVPSAVELAGRLGLAPRIGVRARDAAELARHAEAAAILVRATQTAAVSQLQAREAALEVAAAARAQGLPTCLLKGVALAESGVIAAGSRQVGDVDVLVPADAEPGLVAELVRRGFRSGAGEDYPHHAPPLLHPRLGMIEVHRHLPGVETSRADPHARRRFATFDDLRSAGLLETWRDGGEGAWLPTSTAFAAHALAHCLAQHGFRPGAYPQLRLLGDLLDLGIAAEDGPSLLAATLPLVERSVGAAEARAAADLCHALAAGRLDELAGDAPPALLMRHLLAGALDERYAEALKLQELARPLHAGSRLAGWWSAAWQAVALSPAQLDRVYGKPAGPWGRLGQRLRRPFDLLRRSLRARLASASHPTEKKRAGTRRP